MAHGISFASLTGQAEAVYRNKPAWHKLGRVFESSEGNRLTSERALELSGLGWDTELHPLCVLNADGTPGPAVPEFKATVRSDTKAVLGVVGNRYEVWNNREAFSFLDSFVADGIMEYEAAFALWGGRQVCLVARMPSIDEIIPAENGRPGDSCLRYIIARIGHDGSCPVVLQPTSFRPECANMLRIALSDTRFQVSIKHTASMTAQLEQAKKYLSQFDAKFTEFRDHARKLAGMKYSEEQATEYLNSLFPAPNPKEASEKAIAHFETKMKALRDAFRHRSNQLPGMRGTWWQLFNTATFHIDHQSRTRGKDARSRQENVFANISEGQGAELKNRAMALALEMAV